jgi:hypothetical protein
MRAETNSDLSGFPIFRLRRRDGGQIIFCSWQLKVTLDEGPCPTSTSSDPALRWRSGSLCRRVLLGQRVDTCSSDRLFLDLGTPLSHLDAAVSVSIRVYQLYLRLSTLPFRHVKDAQLSILKPFFFSYTAEASCLIFQNTISTLSDKTCIPGGVSLSSLLLRVQNGACSD